MKAYPRYDEKLWRLQSEIAAALPPQVRALLDISVQSDSSLTRLRLARRLPVSVQTAQGAGSALEIPWNLATSAVTVIEMISEYWRDLGAMIATDTANRLLSIGDGIDLVSWMNSQGVRLLRNGNSWSGDCPMRCRKERMNSLSSGPVQAPGAGFAGKIVPGSDPECAMSSTTSDCATTPHFLRRSNSFALTRTHRR